MLDDRIGEPASDSAIDPPDNTGGGGASLEAPSGESIEEPTAIDPPDNTGGGGGG